MLNNACTNGYLVMDIGEKIANVDEGYVLTSTGADQNPGPMTRSVFQLVRDENSTDLF